MLGRGSRWALCQLNLRGRRRDRRGCRRAEKISKHILQGVFGKKKGRGLEMKLTRLVATIVSNDFGSSTIRQVIASTSILSHFTSGKSCATSAAISSHSTIPFRCALLFVTTVSIFRSLFCAISNANRISRSTPWRVNIATSVAVSHGWPRCERPPWPAYSPSVFSRTMIQSKSPGEAFRNGDSVPRKILVGRTLAYCWKGWQIARRRFQREM